MAKKDSAAWENSHRARVTRGERSARRLRNLGTHTKEGAATIKNTNSAKVSWMRSSPTAGVSDTILAAFDSPHEVFANDVAFKVKLAVISPTAMAEAKPQWNSPSAHNATPQARAQGIATAKEENIGVANGWPIIDAAVGAHRCRGYTSSTIQVMMDLFQTRRQHDGADFSANCKSTIQRCLTAVDSGCNKLSLHGEGY